MPTPHRPQRAVVRVVSFTFFTPPPPSIYLFLSHTLAPCANLTLTHSRPQRKRATECSGNRYNNINAIKIFSVENNGLFNCFLLIFNLKLKRLKIVGACWRLWSAFYTVHTFQSVNAEAVIRHQRRNIETVGYYNDSSTVAIYSRMTRGGRKREGGLREMCWGVSSPWLFALQKCAADAYRDSVLHISPISINRKELRGWTSGKKTAAHRHRTKTTSNGSRTKQNVGTVKSTKSWIRTKKGSRARGTRMYGFGVITHCQSFLFIRSPRTTKAY